MKLSEVPGHMILEFEQGCVPMDEPPGLHEAAYRAWKEAGGTVKTSRPEPATWAIVELMGHVKLAGRITEEEKFGGKLGRLDIPAGDGFLTQYFGAGSVYRISIVSEQVARDVCKRTAPAPVSPWDYPKAIAPPADDGGDSDLDQSGPDLQEQEEWNRMSQEERDQFLTREMRDGGLKH